MKKSILVILGIIIFAVVIEKLISSTDLFENLEFKSHDLRYKLAGKIHFFGKTFNQADKDIVIVALDNYSKKELILYPREDLGPWPWHRDVWNEVVDFIEQGEPKAIMFDMVFENLNENTWYDRRFAQELSKHDNIILGTYLDNPKVRNDNYARKIEIEANDYLPTTQPLKVSIKDKKFEDNITYYMNAPVHNFYTEYNTIGVLNKALDSDNKVRTNQPLFKLVKNGETYYMPSLAFAGFLKYMGEVDNITVKDNKIFYKDRVIPLNNNGAVNINQYKLGRRYSYIPISKILLNNTQQSSLKPDYFKDKLVIIGKTASSGKVDLSSMIDPAYTSPEANAVALDDFINNTLPGDKKTKRFVSEVPKPFQVLITIAACVMVVFFGLMSKSAFIGCLNGIFSILLYLLFCFWLFAHPSSRLIMPIVVPLYYLTITSGIVFAFRFHKEMTKKASLMSIFGKFVSPKVLSNVVKNPANLVLKNTKKPLTILFCDVKDFSNLCEKYDPEKLVSNLNELFKEIVNIIFENNGTVDKFIGDCIMAYWGDLADSEDDEYMAVKTALEIKKKVNELKVLHAQENKVILDVKIGINTGEAVLGLAGTDKIMSYTAMGDAVNVASRLESSCSKYQKDILISKSTYDAIEDKVVVLDVGKISVKGKNEPIEVYEPIGLIEEVESSKQ